MAKDTKQQNGIEYARGVAGKYLFRVREAYIAGPAADLIRLLDLVLRGLALLPEHAGKRNPAMAPPRPPQLLCAQPGTILSAEHHRGRRVRKAWVREHSKCSKREGSCDAPQDLAGRSPDISVTVRPMRRRALR